MQKAYKYSILYFLAFSLLLLVSAVLLFEEKIGFSYESVLAYYMGDEERFVTPKSGTGVLKIILPHIFAFGLFLMVILHFLIFTKVNKSKKIQLIIYLSFGTAFFELFTPFLIINGFEFFAYMKIVSFFSLFFLVIYVSWLLFQSVMYE
jgi:hypothetical protein